MFLGDLLASLCLVIIKSTAHVKCREQVAATNRIDMIDSALLRPGRFDEILHVS